MGLSQTKLDTLLSRGCTERTGACLFPSAEKSPSVPREQENGGGRLSGLNGCGKVVRPDLCPRAAVAKAIKSCSRLQFHQLRPAHTIRGGTGLN